MSLLIIVWPRKSGRETFLNKVSMMYRNVHDNVKAHGKYDDIYLFFYGIAWMNKPE